MSCDSVHQILDKCTTVTLIRSLIVNTRELDHKTILVIAPHPDDETLGCGGFLSAASACGARITLLFLTSGEKGLPCKPPNEAAAIRETEAQAAIEALELTHVELHFMRFPDGNLAGQTETLQEQLGHQIKKSQPDFIFMPHEDDPHEDHRIAAECTRRVVSEIGSALWLYEYPSWLWFRAPYVRTRSGLIGWLHYLITTPFGLFTIWRSGLNTRIDIQDVLDKKRAAARYHASQTQPGFCPEKQNLGELVDGRFLKHLLGRHEYFRRSRISVKT